MLGPLLTRLFTSTSLLSSNAKRGCTRTIRCFRSPDNNHMREEGTDTHLLIGSGPPVSCHVTHVTSLPEHILHF